MRLEKHNTIAIRKRAALRRAIKRQTGFWLSELGLRWWR